MQSLTIPPRLLHRVMGRQEGKQEAASDRDIEPHEEPGFPPLMLLGWPKSSFGFFHKMLWKNLNELFGQPNRSDQLRVGTMGRSGWFPGSPFPSRSLSLSVPQGDSGGPLLCAGVAQGIVSYGQSDAKPPVIFTRISHYRPWINKVLKEN